MGQDSNDNDFTVLLSIYHLVKSILLLVIGIIVIMPLIIIPITIRHEDAAITCPEILKITHHLMGVGPDYNNTHAETCLPD